MKKSIIFGLMIVLLCSLSFGAIDDATLYFNFSNNGFSGDTVLDLSGNGNTGTKNANVSTGLTGVIDEAFNLSRVAYIETTLATGVGSFTMCAWSYRTDDTANQNLISSASEYSFIAVLRNDGETGACNGQGTKWGFGTYDNNTDCALSTTETSLNTWYYICGVHDQTAGKNLIYVNGINEGNETAGNIGSSQAIWLGTRSDKSKSYNGLIDEAVFYPSIKTASEILQLYNSGDGYNPYTLATGGSPAVTGSADLLFANTSTPTTFKSTFQESEKFISYVNYTLSDNSPVNGTVASCYINISNGTQDVDGINTDTTFYNAVYVYENYTFDYNSSTKTITEDYILLKQVCEDGGRKGIDIGINCAGAYYSYNIPSATIPLCPRNITYYIFDLNQTCANATIIYTNYTTLDNTLPLAKHFWESEILRVYETLEMDTVYNSTYGIFQGLRNVEEYKHGTINVTAYCNHTTPSYNATVSELITIVNRPPQITFDNIVTGCGTTNATSPLIIEYCSGIWSWNGEVNDDDLLSFNVSWYYGNGTLIQLNSSLTASTQLNTSDQLFADIENPYYIYVIAIDTNGNTSTINQSFNITDTGFPTFTGIENETIDNNTIYSWNATFFDEYLWQVSWNCTTGSGAKIFNYSRSGIANTSFNFINQTSIALTENMTCSFNASDGHTLKDIPDMLVKIDLEENTLQFDEVTISFNEDITDASYIKNYDSYSFCVTTAFPEERLLVAFPDHFTYAEDSGYDGHFIGGNKWVDLEGEYSGYTIYENSALVYSEEERTEWCFNSIGILNTIYGVQRIGVIEYLSEEMEIGVCPVESEAESLMFLGMLAFSVGLILIGLVKKIGFIGFFGSIMLMILSWYMSGCVESFAYVMALFSFVMIIWFAFISPLGFKNGVYRR